MEHGSGCKSCGSSETVPQKPTMGKQQSHLDENMQILDRMGRIKHKILVLSGKGGVGKSTIAANLAMSLAMVGKKVGLVDIDIHGPSIPKLFGLEGQTITGTPDGLNPVLYNENLKIMSIGFLLPRLDDAVIWRGPMKYGVIKQFLKDVDWGDLDYLIVDSPPGTGDEPLSITQLIPHPDGAVLVTTPQQMSVADVRKSIDFCRILKLPVLGVIENMSGFVCPHCNERVDIFSVGGGKEMAESMMVPYLGSVPIDPKLVTASDKGLPYIMHYPDSETAQALGRAIKLISRIEETAVAQETKEGEKMTSEKLTIAIPLAEGRLALHFGHCAEFLLAEVDCGSQTIVSKKTVPAPPHQPGLLPPWLKEQGATTIIAGGMGQRAQELFTQSGITVVVGAPADNADQIITAYLKGSLQTGQNICDH